MLRLARASRSLIAVAFLGATLSLGGCGFLPESQVDHPISMTVVDGEAHLSWCTGPSVLTRVQVFYSPDGDNAILVADGVGTEIVEDGDDIAVGALLEEWSTERLDYEPNTIRAIDVTLYYTSPDSGDEGFYSVAMDADEGKNVLRSWPEGKWIWASGTVSSDRCGMASSKFR